MYRILIVDDEKNERDCILYLLKNCGFELEIKEAEDGVEALQILKIWPAHILFTDVQMPRMDGLELIRGRTRMRRRVLSWSFPQKPTIWYRNTSSSIPALESR